MSAALIPYFVLAYFLGSIPTAYLVGRLKGVDIRKQGSGNVGATNAFRVLGKGPGIAVFAVDFFKGAIPVWLFKFSQTGHLAPSSTLLLVGLAALLGHVFTPFLGFKGGKGVATGAGLLTAGFPALFGISLLVWLTVFFSTRIVSISSLCAAVALAVSGFVLGYQLRTCWMFTGIAAFIFWTHRANIGRLLKGEEGIKVNSSK